LFGASAGLSRTRLQKSVLGELMKVNKCMRELVIVVILNVQVTSMVSIHITVACNAKNT